MSRALKNGDTLVFNTDPATMCSVVGCPGLVDDGYGLLFAPRGTVEDVEVKKITKAQLAAAVAGKLVNLPPDVEIESPKPKKKRKAKAKKAIASKAPVAMPWGK